MKVTEKKINETNISNSMNEQQKTALNTQKNEENEKRRKK